jgi:hypothetical protein
MVLESGARTVDSTSLGNGLGKQPAASSPLFVISCREPLKMNLTAKALISVQDWGTGSAGSLHSSTYVNEGALALLELAAGSLTAC